MKIQTKCPYCGFENPNKEGATDTGRNVTGCPLLFGGCGRDYLVEVEASISVRVSKLTPSRLKPVKE